MSKRIRYIEEDTGVFQSVKAFEGNNRMLRVKYNTSNMVVIIYDLNTMEDLRTFVSPNLPVMKKTIKDTLKELGVAFEPELRNGQASF